MSGFLVNDNTPIPLFFVSADSKEFNLAVSPLEATLPRGMEVRNTKDLGNGTSVKTRQNAVFAHKCRF